VAQADWLGLKVGGRLVLVLHLSELTMAQPRSQNRHFCDCLLLFAISVSCLTVALCYSFSTFTAAVETYRNYLWQCCRKCCMSCMDRCL